MQFFYEDGKKGINLDNPNWFSWEMVWVWREMNRYGGFQRGGVGGGGGGFLGYGL